MGNEPDTSAADRAQIASSAPEVVQVPMATLSGDNDKWLADSIGELKEKDAHYARLQSEEAREQWENLTRDNLERQRRHEENQTGQAAADAARTQFHDDAKDLKLLQYADEISTRLRQEFPNGFTAQSIPLDLHRAIITTNQQLEESARRRGVEPIEGGVIPTTWTPGVQPGGQTVQPAQNGTQAIPDGKLYEITQNGDGTVEVRLETGERFVGDPMKVTEELAKSKVHTTRWARQKAQSQANGNGSAPSGEVSDFGTWAADETARGLGFADRNEMVQFGEQLRAQHAKTNEFIEDQQLRSMAADFMQRCPDFPDTPFAQQALGRFVAQNNWDPTPDNLEAAHAALVRQKVYAPLSVEEQNATWANNMQAASRPTPPPMLRSTSPDAENRDGNPWTEPLDKMRARLIEEQLEQSAIR